MRIAPIHIRNHVAWCVVAFVMCGTNLASAVTTGDSAEKALDSTIAEFSCVECTIEEFANRLARTGIAACLHRDVELPPRENVLTIKLKDVTPRQILEQSIPHFPEYTWRWADANMINILPVAELLDPDSRLHAPVTYEPGEPVLLSRAVNDLLAVSRQTNHPLKGIVGSQLGPQPDPLLNLSFTNVPFLEVLNSIFQSAGSAYSWSTTSKFIAYGRTSGNSREAGSLSGALSPPVDSSASIHNDVRQTPVDD